MSNSTKPEQHEIIFNKNQKPPEISENNQIKTKKDMNKITDDQNKIRKALTESVSKSILEKISWRIPMKKAVAMLPQVSYPALLLMHNYCVKHMQCSC